MHLKCTINVVFVSFLFVSNFFFLLSLGEMVFSRTFEIPAMRLLVLVSTMYACDRGVWLHFIIYTYVWCNVKSEWRKIKTWLTYAFWMHPMPLEKFVWFGHMFGLSSIIAYSIYLDVVHTIGMFHRVFWVNKKIYIQIQILYISLSLIFHVQTQESTFNSHFKLMAAIWNTESSTSFVGLCVCVCFSLFA